MAFKPVTIEQEWQTLCSGIFNGDEPEIQRSEMKRAFYSGAASVLGIYVRIGEADVSEDQAITVIEQIAAELGAFGEAISNGKA